MKPVHIGPMWQNNEKPVKKPATKTEQYELVTYEVELITPLAKRFDIVSLQGLVVLFDKDNHKFEVYKLTEFLKKYGKGNEDKIEFGNITIIGLNKIFEDQELSKIKKELMKLGGKIFVQYAFPRKLSNIQERDLKSALMHGFYNALRVELENRKVKVSGKPGELAKVQIFDLKIKDPIFNVVSLTVGSEPKLKQGGAKTPFFVEVLEKAKIEVQYLVAKSILDKLPDEFVDKIGGFKTYGFGSVRLRRK